MCVRKLPVFVSSMVVDRQFVSIARLQNVQGFPFNKLLVQSYMGNLITDELHPNRYRWAMDNENNMTSGECYYGH